MALDWVSCCKTDWGDDRPKSKGTLATIRCLVARVHRLDESVAGPWESVGSTQQMKQQKPDRMDEQGKLKIGV